jgi:N-acetylmuramoyl-L-alanine amidase
MNIRERNHFLPLLLILVIFLLAGVAVGTSPGRHRSRNASDDLLEAEQRLSGLGYRISKVDGVADASTRHAIIAFQKVEGLERTGNLDGGVMESLRFATRPLARFNTGLEHIEIDITRQVLFLADGQGTVIYILSVSTGNEQKYFDEGRWQIAHTPRGRFRIERKIKGVRRAPLGSLYYPNYFYRGVAIHGSSFVPVYPDSHGCVRIPRFADKEFFVFALIGMEVFVYN